MRFRISLLTVTALVVSALLGAEAAATCDLDYVTRDGSILTVLPTGVDDTENLQCAFDTAVAGDTVQLVAGRYHTAQIMPSDFVGAFRGAGARRTVVQNLVPLDVTMPSLFVRPSPSATWPSIFAFWGGDFVVSDLTIKAVGTPPTTGWTPIPGLYLEELAHAIVILGPEAHVAIHDVRVEGRAWAGGLYGTNLINGVFPEGCLGGHAGLMRGSFSVERSRFRMVADPAPLFCIEDFTSRIAHNRFDSALGLSAAEFVGSSLEWAHNRVDSLLGVWLYDGGALPYGAIASDVLVRNNRFAGGGGPFIDVTYGPAMSCMLLANNTSPAEFGIYLGSGTNGCIVVGAGPHVRVVDLGTDNVIVGINNQGEGIGRDVSTILETFRMLRGQ